MSKCSAKNRRCAGGDEWCIGGTLRIEDGGMFDLYGDKFGKETVHDTLVWDGNTDGLAYVPYYGDNFYKISDVVPRPEDLASGYTLIFSDLSGNVGEYEVVTEEALDCEKGDYHLSNQLLIVRKSESLEAEGIMDAEEGVYFRKFEDIFNAGLKIPNYTGFEKTTVYHPIPAEYLPDSAGGGVTDYYTNTNNQYLFKDGNCETKVTKDEVLKALDGMIRIHTGSGVPEYLRKHYIVTSYSVQTSYVELVVTQPIDEGLRPFSYYTKEWVSGPL